LRVIEGGAGEIPFDDAPAVSPEEREEIRKGMLEIAAALGGGKRL
jgi:hypothetical protein